MKVVRKAKSDHDCDPSRVLRREELLSLAGSLSDKDAEELRDAIKTVRKNWR